MKKNYEGRSDSETASTYDVWHLSSPVAKLAVKHKLNKIKNNFIAYSVPYLRCTGYLISARYRINKEC